MSAWQKTAVSTILILVPPHTNEKQIAYCQKQWQQQGITVVLIPMRPAASQQHVDQPQIVSLSDAKGWLADVGQPSLLWLAGGVEAAAVVLADPRTHELAQHILAAGGFVAAHPEAYGLLRETGLLRSVWAERFLWWEGGEGGNGRFCAEDH